MRPALALALALAAGTAGCTTDQGFLPVAVTRPLDLDLRGVDLNSLPVERGVEGSDTRVSAILFFPTLDGPRLETAIENGLVRGGGDVMTRVRVTSTDWWFLIGVSTLTVRGDVIDLEGAR